MHSWGDDWDWGGFNTACGYLERLYERATKSDPMMWKEKWGCLRLEWEGIMWMKTNEEAVLFDKCMKRTIRKYPKFAAELAAGMWGFNAPYDNFYAGVVFASRLKYKDERCND